MPSEEMFLVYLWSYLWKVSPLSMLFNWILHPLANVNIRQNREGQAEITKNPKLFVNCNNKGLFFLLLHIYIELHMGSAPYFLSPWFRLKKQAPFEIIIVIMTEGRRT